MKSLFDKQARVLFSALAIVLSTLLAGCGGGNGPAFGTASDGGELLGYQTFNIPNTDISSATVLVSGKANDPALIAKLMQVNGQTAAQVAYFLTSYDTTGSNTVKVLLLNDDTYVTRNWGPASKLGRWYAPARTDYIDSPYEARVTYALPELNNARYITLYKLKRGSVAVYGLCSDMSGNPPTFGPYAKGGGTQFYSPNSTKWVVDHAEINPDVMELISELRYAR